MTHWPFSVGRAWVFSLIVTVNRSPLLPFSKLFALLQNACLVAYHCKCYCNDIFQRNFFLFSDWLCLHKVHRSPVRQQQTHWQCSKKKSKQLSISILCCKLGRSSCFRLHGTCRTLWAKPNWGPSGAAVLSYLFSKICGKAVHIFPYSSLNGYLFKMLVL